MEKGGWLDKDLIVKSCELEVVEKPGIDKIYHSYSEMTSSLLLWMDCIIS